MNTEISKLEGLNVEWLQRYVNMRDKFDQEANSIYAITSLIALLEVVVMTPLTLIPSQGVKYTKHSILIF